MLFRSSQLVLGAVLRHVPLAASPGVFRAALILHLLFAVALVGYVLAASWRARQLPREASRLKTLSALLSVFVVAQIALGLATYVAKYAFPAWLGDYGFAAAYVVQEKGLAQSLITTAHVATGSLILFTSVVSAVGAMRLFAIGQAASLPIGEWHGGDKLAACLNKARAAA